MFRNENIKKNILLLKNKEFKFFKYIMNDTCMYACRVLLDEIIKSIWWRRDRYNKKRNKIIKKVEKMIHKEIR